MRLVPCMLILLLSLSASSAMAQTQEMSPAPAPQTPERAAEPLASEAESMAAQAEEQAEKLRAELKELLRSRGIGEAANEPSGGISNGQVYGFASGVITGALVAAAIGSGGIGTIVLASGGGALGNWFMAD